MRDVTSLIADFIPTLPRATFVQIGAGDGVSGDPIHVLVLRNSWTGMLVEPVPYLFEQLVRNYAGHSGLRFENCAVAESSGTVPFWYLRESDENGLPPWYNQLGTFKLEILLKHESDVPNLRGLLEKTNVDCKSLRELISGSDSTALDLLLIDAEGYDDAIVKQVDGNAVAPHLVVFERKHLNLCQFNACFDHLTSLGYEIFECHHDALAVRRVDFGDHLHRES